MKTELETALEILATAMDTMQVLSDEYRHKEYDDADWENFLVAAKFLKEHGKRNYVSSVERAEGYLNRYNEESVPSEWWSGGFAKNH